MSTPNTSEARLWRRSAALGPEPVRGAVGLQGQEPLVVEEAVEHPVAGRVAVAGRQEVGARGAAGFRVRGERVGEEVPERLLRQRAGDAELGGKVRGQGGLQRGARQYQVGVELAEERLGLRVGQRPRAQLVPDLVVAEAAPAAAPARR
jgi:hypothetical protein